MEGVNQVILIGTLGRDPETKYIPSGTAVTNFSLATSRKWRDSNNEMQEKTEWHNIQCWAKLAEVAGEHLAKGSRVYIQGELETQSWEKEGVKKYKTLINARQMQFLDRKGDGPQQQSRQSAPAPAAKQDDGFDDDIPF